MLKSSLYPDMNSSGMGLLRPSRGSVDGGIYTTGSFSLTTAGTKSFTGCCTKGVSDLSNNVRNENSYSNKEISLLDEVEEVIENVSLLSHAFVDEVGADYAKRINIRIHLGYPLLLTFDMGSEDDLGIWAYFTDPGYQSTYCRSFSWGTT